MSYPQSTCTRCLMIAAGGVIISFGLYNIHAQADVTEGGILGLTLLIEYWTGLSPAVSSLILNLACYFLGWRVLGRDFIPYSLLSSACFSLAYRVFERFPPVFPSIAAYPLEAAVLGAVFVGVGSGLSVRAGAAQCGDDALAMALSHKFGLSIKRIYIVSDLLVLLGSLSYLPLRRIAWSLLTVFLSGQVIGVVVEGFPNRKAKDCTG